jgi:uncharacterized repeat protein (TIGR03803 family)
MMRRSERLSITASFYLLICFASAQAQSFSVLHQFTGGTDGSNPMSNLVLDRAGNLYGVAPYGGSQMCQTSNGIGCGTAFKLTHRGGGWTFSTLYQFTGHGDGANPIGNPMVASDGTLFGTTNAGGNGNCRDTYGDGCGTVFRLQPQPNICASLSCPWNETQLYKFTGPADGNDPWAGVVLDQHGNLYGAAYAGGSLGFGVFFQVSPSGSTWLESTIHAFAGGPDGANPNTTPILDTAGNLYGTTLFGGGDGGCTLGGCGSVYQFMPSGSQWFEAILYNFPGSYRLPQGGVVLDPQGNLYGTFNESINGIFQLSPSFGGWVFTLLYSDELDMESFHGTLARDAAGNLYGTSQTGGNSTNCQTGCGFVYRLSPSGGGWTFTSLYQFTGGSDGAYPIGGVVLDSSGNLYGTTSGGGTNRCGSTGCGVVWKIAPQS